MIEVLFIAGFGPIVRDSQATQRLYGETLGLPLVTEDGEYFSSNGIDGVKEFALWPLAQAAESCFGTPAWPADFPIPQAWMELDVADIEAATRDLEASGYKLLVAARLEPWGQTVTRWLSPEGLLLGLSHTPWLRGEGERPQFG